MKDIRWIEGIRIYCDKLVEVNKDFLKLLAVDCIDQNHTMEIIFISICYNLSILIPLSNRYGEFSLLENEGVLDLKDEIDFISNDYNELFKKNIKLLRIIKKVRDKMEHRPHNLHALSTSSGNHAHATIEFIYGEKDEEEFMHFNLDTNDLKKIIIELNIIYDNIINKLKLFRSTKTECLYLRRYTKLNFLIFNDIYNSNSSYDLSYMLF